MPYIRVGSFIAFVGRCIAAELGLQPAVRIPATSSNSYDDSALDPPTNVRETLVSWSYTWTPGFNHHVPPPPPPPRKSSWATISAFFSAANSTPEGIFINACNLAALSFLVGVWYGARLESRRHEQLELEPPMEDPVVGPDHAEGDPVVVPENAEALRPLMEDPVRPAPAKPRRRNADRVRRPLSPCRKSDRVRRPPSRYT